MTVFSIIIPMHNSEKTIGKCLRAVFASNFRDFEVIAVDDASTDNTLEIARKFPCKIIHLKRNLGQAKARNVGAKVANGKILIFLDSDALLKKDTLQKVVDALANRGLDAVGGMIALPTGHTDLATFYKNAHHHYFQTKLATDTNVLSGVLFAIRKKVFENAGGFNERFREAEDIELSQRLSKNGFKIRLDKSIEVVHLQTYSFLDILKKDFWKAFYWVRLIFHISGSELLREKRFTNKPMDLLFSILMPFLAILFLVAFLLTSSAFFLATCCFFFLIFLALNAPFFYFMAKLIGPLHLVVLVPLRIINMLAIGTGAFFGLLHHFLWNRM